MDEVETIRAGKDAAFLLRTGQDTEFLLRSDNGFIPKPMYTITIEAEVRHNMMCAFEVVFYNCGISRECAYKFDLLCHLDEVCIDRLVDVGSFIKSGVSPLAIINITVARSVAFMLKLQREDAYFCVANGGAEHFIFKLKLGNYEGEVRIERGWARYYFDNTDC